MAEQTLAARVLIRMGGGTLGPFEILPENVRSRMYDQIIDRFAAVAESLVGKKAANRLRRMRSSPTFTTELSAAIGRASERVAHETAYPEVLQEIMAAERLWSSDDILTALEQVIRNPGARWAEQAFLTTRFSEVLPSLAVDTRYALVLTELVEAIIDEIWHHPGLVDVYMLRMQRASVEQGGALLEEVRGLRADNRSILTAMSSNDRSGLQELASAERAMKQRSIGAGPSSTRPQGLTLGEVCDELLTSASSRDSFLVRLPRLKVPCTMFASGREPVVVPDASTIADSFVNDETSNLLVVLGEFGSGKSEVLRRVARRALERGDLPILFDYAELASNVASDTAAKAIEKRLADLSHRAAVEFSERVKSDPGRLLVLVDAFDEVNLSLDADELPADLRSLAPLLASKVKTVVAARRSLTATPDEFVRQLQNPVRAQRFGASSYQIVELRPCPLNEVNKALVHLPREQAATMREYLTTRGQIQMDRVRRPLFLQMLIDLPSQVFASNTDFSIYRLYDLYVDMTLERDVERAASLIPVGAKRRVLQSVARDMFDAQVRRAEARLSSDDVRVRVNEEVRRHGGEGWVASAPNSGYQWAVDFVRSNQLLVERSRSSGRDTPDVAFVHHSLFEFFLAQHLISEFETRGEFGIRDDVHSVRAFDSLLPYFLRSHFGSGFEEELTRLVMSERTSNLDRLLAFFFLEDSPRIRELLKAMPKQYLSFLMEAEWTFESFFMQKVVRFQIALLDRGIGRALAYVSDLRIREVDQDQDIEVHTFAAGRSSTEFLLARLRNPALANVQPITVYRLGQFGDGRAVGPLREMVQPSLDPSFRGILIEALDRISERSSTGLSQ